MNELVKAVGLAIGATDLPEAQPPLDRSRPATTRPVVPTPDPRETPPWDDAAQDDTHHAELVALKDAAEDFPFRLLTACREAARITNSVEQWERFERAVDAFVSARG